MTLVRGGNLARVLIPRVAGGGVRSFTPRRRVGASQSTRLGRAISSQVRDAVARMVPVPRIVSEWRRRFSSTALLADLLCGEDTLRGVSPRGPPGRLFFARVAHPPGTGRFSPPYGS